MSHLGSGTGICSDKVAVFCQNLLKLRRISSQLLDPILVARCNSCTGDIVQSVFVAMTQALLVGHITDLIPQVAPLAESHMGLGFVFLTNRLALALGSFGGLHRTFLTGGYPF